MTLELKPLHPLDALSASCREYPGGMIALAARMGKTENTLRKELAQGVQTHRIGYDEELSTILFYLADAKVSSWADTLHAFAYRHNHLMVPIPEADGQDSERLVEMVCLLVKEIGDVGGCLTSAKSASSESGKYISTREFDNFNLQVEEAMSALAALREQVRKEHQEAVYQGLTR